MRGTGGGGGGLSMNDYLANDLVNPDECVFVAGWRGIITRPVV